MPKIFLIKNRLHQQQLRLLEAQNNLLNKDSETDRLVPPLSPTRNNNNDNDNNNGTSSTNGSDNEPLSLISRKRFDEQVRDIFQVQDCNRLSPTLSTTGRLSSRYSHSTSIKNRSRSKSPILDTNQQQSISENSNSSIKNNSNKSPTPSQQLPFRRRFISSIFGGDIPYDGSRTGPIVLTQAQRKEYPPPNPISLFNGGRTTKTPTTTTSPAPLSPTKDKHKLEKLIIDKSDTNKDNNLLESSISTTTTRQLIVEDKPIVPPENEPLSLIIKTQPPPPDKRPSPPPPPEPAVRCSVIQRTPKPTATTNAQQKSSIVKSKENDIKLPFTCLANLGPEQEQPIDYAVPKRKTTTTTDNLLDDDSGGDKLAEKEKRMREARRRSAILAATRYQMRHHHHNSHNNRLGKIHGIIIAAAGHGRSSNNNSQQTAGNTPAGHQNGNGNSCGQSLQFNGSSSGNGQLGGSAGGAAGIGGTGGGGGGSGGRDGRSNYGPNSPPTGSLPPFYESLKSGNNGMNFNAANSNFLAQHGNYLGIGGQLDCPNDTNHEISVSGGGGGVGNGIAGNSYGVSNNNNNDHHKHFSMLNNSAYGIVLKDEPDLEYDTNNKIDISNLEPHLLQNGCYNGYDVNDSMMVDIASGGVVDPLQFTGTLTFSTPGEGLLDSFTDAVDLSSFLQRLPNDNNNNNNNNNNTSSPGQDLDLTSTPSLTPDSVSITPVDNQQNCLDSFSENIIQQMQNGQRQCYDQRYCNIPISGGGGSGNKNYHHHDTQQQQPPPSYQQTREMLHMQQQQQQQHHPLHHNSNSHHNLTTPHPHHQNNNNNHHQHHHNSNHHHHHNHSGLNHTMMASSAVQQYHNNSTTILGGSGGSDNSNLSLPSPGGSSSSGLLGSTNFGGSQGALDIPPEAKPIIQSVSCYATASIITSLPPDATILAIGGNPSGSCNSNINNGDRCYNYDLLNDNNNNNIEKKYKSRRQRKPQQQHQNRKNNNSNKTSRTIKSRSSSSSSSSPMIVHDNNKLHILLQRLGLSADVQLEFVNGGHGIKNPLALENLHGNRIRDSTSSDESKKNLIIAEDDPNKFACRICSKSFTLQRLLNRHMKCHSDIKRYLCTFCGKGFNDTFDLKRHTRTHTGVRPYKCNLCEKSFTQRCSLESHCLKVHGVQHQYAYKERRTKMYVCEECGHTTSEPEVHYLHLKENHPYSPALLKFYDKRHFKFTNSQFANNLLGALPMPVHN